MVRVIDDHHVVRGGEAGGEIHRGDARPGNEDRAPQLPTPRSAGEAQVRRDGHVQAGQGRRLESLAADGDVIGANPGLVQVEDRLRQQLALAGTGRGLHGQLPGVATHRHLQRRQGDTELGNFRLTVLQVDGAAHLRRLERARDGHIALQPAAEQRRLAGQCAQWGKVAQFHLQRAAQGAGQQVVPGQADPVHGQAEMHRAAVLERAVEHGMQPLARVIGPQHLGAPLQLLRAAIAQIERQAHVGNPGVQGTTRELRTAAGEIEGGGQPPLQDPVAVQLTSQGGETDIGRARLQPPGAVTAGPVPLGTDPAGGSGQAEGLQLDPVGGGDERSRLLLLPGAKPAGAALRLLHPAPPLSVADPALHGEAGRPVRPLGGPAQAVRVH